MRGGVGVAFRLGGTRSGAAGAVAPRAPLAAAALARWRTFSAATSPLSSAVWPSLRSVHDVSAIASPIARPARLRCRPRSCSSTCTRPLPSISRRRRRQRGVARSTRRCRGSRRRPRRAHRAAQRRRPRAATARGDINVGDVRVKADGHPARLEPRATVLAHRVRQRAAQAATVREQRSGVDQISLHDLRGELHADEPAADDDRAWRVAQRGGGGVPVARRSRRVGSAAVGLRGRTGTRRRIQRAVVVWQRERRRCRALGDDDGVGRDRRRLADDEVAALARSGVASAPRLREEAEDAGRILEVVLHVDDGDVTRGRESPPRRPRTSRRR